MQLPSAGAEGLVEISILSFRAALGRVCMKLVVVMGVTWIMDVISWAVGGPQELWYLPDLINCLQGVFIFIVIGCQPQVRYFNFFIFPNLIFFILSCGVGFLPNVTNELVYGCFRC